jgi:MoxR-like ATPase
MSEELRLDLGANYKVKRGDTAHRGLIVAAKDMSVSVGDPKQFIKDQNQKFFAKAPNAPAGLDAASETLELSSGHGPRFVRYFGAVLNALRALGGKGKPKDVLDWIVANVDVPQFEIDGVTKGGKKNFGDIIGWARFHLVKGGCIEHNQRGIWVLTQEGRETFLDSDAALALYKALRLGWKEKDDEKPALASADAVTERVGTDAAGSVPYSILHISKEGCFLHPEAIADTLQCLKEKKNLILQGPPGTGKSWLAKRLAHALLGVRDGELARARIQVVQFHASFAYEDFVRGWRGTEAGRLDLVDGVFLRCVQAASSMPEPFILIIDEINRGNTAQIFGDMLTLLEDTKRRPEEALEPTYSRDGERIHIPPNLYVIGTMNVADRSLALIDMAMRRRFAFISLEPQLGPLWRAWCSERGGLAQATVAMIEEKITALNNEIANDRSLGPQFRIGHSYVTPVDGARIPHGDKWFVKIVQTQIGPLLEEYWFDAPEKAAAARRRLLARIT